MTRTLRVDANATDEAVVAVKLLSARQPAVAAIATPIKRHHINLLYHCGTRGLTLQMHLVKYIWQLLWGYRGIFGPASLDM